MLHSLDIIYLNYGFKLGEMEFSIVLVRHGETTANRDRLLQVLFYYFYYNNLCIHLVLLLQGSADYPLNDLGRLQAEKVAQKLCKDKFHMAMASDLSRAYDTCKAIVQANQDEGMEAVITIYWYWIDTIRQIMALFGYLQI